MGHPAPAQHYNRSKERNMKHIKPKIKKLTLYFNRAKLFMLGSDSGELRYTNGVGKWADVPEWVTQTDTYKYGIKDGSIVDLTPPERPAAPVVAAEPDQAPDPVEPEEDGETEEEEEEEPAQAPSTPPAARGFVSGQPLQPRQPTAAKRQGKTK